MIDIVIMAACVIGLATIAVIRIIAKEHEEPVPNPFTPWSGTNGSADSLIDPQDDTNSNYDRSRE